MFVSSASKVGSRPCCCICNRFVSKMNDEVVVESCCCSMFDIHDYMD
jgi:hypothetical protein